MTTSRVREPFQEKQAAMRLIVCEDNEAVIKIVLKQRSPALRHVSRTHRICLDWTYEVMQNQCVSLKYVNTKYQIADMMTKAFTKKDLWETLLTFSALGFSSERGGAKSPHSRCKWLVGTLHMMVQKMRESRRSSPEDMEKAVKVILDECRRLPDIIGEPWTPEKQQFSASSLPAWMRDLMQLDEERGWIEMKLRELATKAVKADKSYDAKGVRRRVEHLVERA